jgi:maltose alpha-D-glucosyltransferase/alpha-amylase
MDAVDDRWYRDAVVYELSVRTFADENGDGVGDFRGLTRRLDYLEGLGATAIWLLPFQPSPGRDDGYDISNHYGVDPAYGDLGDFVRFVEHARDRGMRVLIDLVLNHTSDEHPWFQAARAGDEKLRDYYVWSPERPPDAEKGVVFPGVQKSTWSYDRTAKRWYFHRFYDFQPDLNIANPAVRDEMEKIIGFWLNLGISGFRVDAVPFLIEPVSATNTSPSPEFDWLHGFRSYLSWRSGSAVLLGEANVEREQVTDYVGVGGMHMLFNFEANQHLWLAFAREEAAPLADALRDTAGIPGADRWATFLRNNDELDLGADARPRPPSDRARVLAAVLAPRHAGAVLRRRDRDGRRPVPAGAQRGPDADAVVERAERRLLDRAANAVRPAGRRARRLRVSTGERGRPVPRSLVAPALRAPRRTGPARASRARRRLGAGSRQGTGRAGGPLPARRLRAPRAAQSVRGADAGARPRCRRPRRRVLQPRVPCARRIRRARRVRLPLAARPGSLLTP